MHSPFIDHFAQDPMVDTTQVLISGRTDKMQGIQLALCILGLHSHPSNQPQMESIFKCLVSLLKTFRFYPLNDTVKQLLMGNLHCIWHFNQFRDDLKYTRR